MSYKIDWTDGRTPEYRDTLEGCDELIRGQYPNCVYLDDGALSDLPKQSQIDEFESVLVWIDEDESEDDAGENAIASIRGIEEEFTIQTDASSMDIKAMCADQAAAKFAASESSDWRWIKTVDQLAKHVEGMDGWLIVSVGGGPLGGAGADVYRSKSLSLAND